MIDVGLPNAVRDRSYIQKGKGIDPYSTQQPLLECDFNVYANPDISNKIKFEPALLKLIDQ